jgi:hypothetical protein
MRFEVHAEITEVYIIEAEDMNEAIQKASDMTEPSYTNHQGFSYIRNNDTNEDRTL